MQQLFDQAVSAILNQGAPSKFPESGMCAYRGPHQNRCAVGWLIHDDYYDPDFEGIEVGIDPNILEAVMQSHPDAQVDVDLLLDMQRAHDAASETGPDFIPDFRARAMGVAQLHGLNWNF